MTRIHLERPPRTDLELYLLVKGLWGITIPRHKVCLEHDAPFTAFATAFFAREPQILIHGSRGLSGKSVLMSILGLTNAVVWGADCNILGGSLAQSNNVLESMNRAWESENAPGYMLVAENKQEHILTNSAKIRPLTASTKTVRGPHPARLLLDEIDEMDQFIFDSAKGQPMPQRNWLGVDIPAQTTMASTWHYPDGVMTSEMNRFKDEDLPIYTWCFKDSSNPIDGWLHPDTVAQKRREISREMWRVEYELGEPSIGNRAIDSNAVERMFDVGAPNPLKWTRDYQEYGILKYDFNREYVIAADWARDKDWTVIGVWDVTERPMRLAYYLRMQRRPYPDMIGRFNTLMKRYKAEAIHDATGLGAVVSDLIDGRARNFLMTGEKRDKMLSEYVAAVENDYVRASRIDSLYTATKYVSTDDLYSRSKEFHLPDEVCSAALAWKLVSRRYPSVAPYAPAKANNNWMGSAVEKNTPSEYANLTTGEVEERRVEELYSFS
jgi:hypothetical protein